MKNVLILTAVFVFMGYLGICVLIRNVNKLTKNTCTVPCSVTGFKREDDMGYYYTKDHKLFVYVREH